MSAIVGVLLLQSRLVLAEEAGVLDEPGFDVLVVQELREEDELLSQELVREIHLENFRSQGLG